MSFKILVAVAGFQRELTVREAANAVVAGLRRVQPDVEAVKLPIVDGGEGFTAALVDATGGTMHPASVTSPWGEQLRSFFGILSAEGPRTVVIEAAAAAGKASWRLGTAIPALAAASGSGSFCRSP